MSGKRYTEEFKKETVKQIQEEGYTVSRVAQRLGVSTNSLYTWLKKGGSILRKRVPVKYAFIRDHSPEFNTQLLCRMMNVHPSGYYTWLKETLKRWSKIKGCYHKRLKALQ